MKQGKLTDKRIERLNSIGFQWAIKPAHDKAWEEKFEKLVEFKNTPSNHTEQEVKLRQWVSKKVRLMKAGKLSRHRKEKMESVGFPLSQFCEFL